MTPLDLKLVPKAKALLQKYGASATLTRGAYQNYDPKQGEAADGGQIQAAVKATPPSPTVQSWGSSDGDVASLMEVFIPAQGLPFVPDDGDSIVFGINTTSEETWSIVLAQPVRTGELVALYRLGVRR